MGEHTKGPWLIKRMLGGTASVIIGGVKRKYTNGIGQDQLFMVCGVQDDNGGDAAQTANANLVVGAPELLEACNAAWNCIAELSPTQARVEVAQMLQAAISKATGASHE
jgi:hypothetical protein